MKSNVDGPSPATIMEQGLRSIASVQAYNLENKVGDDYEAALLHDAVDNFYREWSQGSSTYGFSQFAIFLSFAVIFFVGSNLLYGAVLCRLLHSIALCHVWCIGSQFSVGRF
jgi:hypothetical protein